MNPCSNDGRHAVPPCGDSFVKKNLLMTKMNMRENCVLRTIECWEEVDNLEKHFIKDIFLFIRCSPNITSSFMITDSNFV